MTTAGREEVMAASPRHDLGIYFHNDLLPFPHCVPHTGLSLAPPPSHHSGTGQPPDPVICIEEAGWPGSSSKFSSRQQPSSKQQICEAGGVTQNYRPNRESRNTLLLRTLLQLLPSWPQAVAPLEQQSQQGHRLRKHRHHQAVA